MFSIGFIVLMAVGALSAMLVALFGLSSARVPAARRSAHQEAEKSLLTVTSERLSESIDALLQRRGWIIFSARDLEIAGIRMSQSALVIVVTSCAIAVFAIISTIQHPLAGLLMALMVPIGAWIWLKMAASRRQHAFADQLEATMQIMSSALRAGHSFPRSLDTVARESAAPTSEEFARIVNENRLGRDLIEAMRQTGYRMNSEDFGWVTDAVAIQRDTGGNLSEVLDRVATTIRERNELKQQIHALSAEGRISAIVLMSLPVCMAVFYSLMNPGYLAPLFQTSIGRLLLIGSAILYVVGALWMRALIQVKF